MQRILPPKKEHIRPWSSLPGSGKIHDFGGVRVHGDRTGHGGGGSVLTVVRVATALPTVKQTTNHCINSQNNAIKKNLYLIISLFNIIVESFLFQGDQCSLISWVTPTNNLCSNQFVKKKQIVSHM